MMKNCGAIVLFLDDDQTVDMLRAFALHYRLLLHLSQMSSKLQVVTIMRDTDRVVLDASLHHLHAIVLDERYLLPALAAEIIHPVLHFGARASRRGGVEASLKESSSSLETSYRELI